MKTNNKVAIGILLGGLILIGIFVWQFGAFLGIKPSHGMPSDTWRSNMQQEDSALSQTQATKNP